MDAAFDPPPALEMEQKRELVRGEGAKATRCFTTVLLRAMRASREPSLTREESIAWASYVVVKIAARMIRCHPTPSAFDELLRAMAATRVVDADAAGDGASWRPTRRAAGWLLLRELRRDRVPRVRPRAARGLLDARVRHGALRRSWNRVFFWGGELGGDAGRGASPNRDHGGTRQRTAIDPEAYPRIGYLHHWKHPRSPQQPALTALLTLGPGAGDVSASASTPREIRV